MIVIGGRLVRLETLPRPVSPRRRYAGGDQAHPVTLAAAAARAFVLLGRAMASLAPAEARRGHADGVDRRR